MSHSTKHTSAEINTNREHRRFHAQKGTKLIWHHTGTRSGLWGHLRPPIQSLQPCATCDPFGHL